MEVLSLNTTMMSRAFYNFTKNWEYSRNDVVSDKLPEWQNNAGLMNWLKNLGK